MIKYTEYKYHLAAFDLGDRMGRDVRFDEGPDRQLADSGGNFPAPVRYGIRLHPALRPRTHVGREPARRTAAGGRGAERRVALFPYRKHGSGVRPGLERFADRLHGARVDRRGDEPLLSRRADVAAADRRLGAGIRGMVLVVLNGHFVLRLSPRGDMLALSAAMLWMVYSLVIKRLGGRYPAIFITRKVFFYGLVTILPVFAFRPFGADWEVLSRPVVWGNLLFLGVVASMLCYVLWNAAMHRLGAVRTTNYIYFNPLVTIVAATLCIGERITLAALAGAALILYGMWRAERA